MRLASRFYLLTVVLVATCYAYVTTAWVSALSVGLDAFPGSPDWAWHAAAAERQHAWMGGLLLGLVLAGVSLGVAASTASAPGSVTRRDRALLLAALLLGASAWSVGETLTHRAASAADALGVQPPPGQTPGRCP